MPKTYHTPSMRMPTDTNDSKKDEEEIRLFEDDLKYSEEGLRWVFAFYPEIHTLFDPWKNRMCVVEHQMEDVRSLIQSLFGDSFDEERKVTSPSEKVKSNALKNPSSTVRKLDLGIYNLKKRVDRLIYEKNKNNTAVLAYLNNIKNRDFSMRLENIKNRCMTPRELIGLVLGSIDQLLADIDHIYGSAATLRPTENYATAQSESSSTKTAEAQPNTEISEKILTPEKADPKTNIEQSKKGVATDTPKTKKTQMSRQLNRTTAQPKKPASNMPRTKIKPDQPKQASTRKRATLKSKSKLPEKKSKPKKPKAQNSKTLGSKIKKNRIEAETARNKIAKKFSCKPLPELKMLTAIEILASQFICSGVPHRILPSHRRAYSGYGGEDLYIVNENEQIPGVCEEFRRDMGMNKNEIIVAFKRGPKWVFMAIQKKAIAPKDKKNPAHDKPWHRDLYD